MLRAHKAFIFRHLVDLRARASSKHAHGPEFLVGERWIDIYFSFFFNKRGKSIAAMMNSLALAKLIVLTRQHCNPVIKLLPILFFEKETVSIKKQRRRKSGEQSVRRPGAVLGGSCSHFFAASLSIC